MVTTTPMRNSLTINFEEKRSEIKSALPISPVLHFDDDDDEYTEYRNTNTSKSPPPIMSNLLLTGNSMKVPPPATPTKSRELIDHSANFQPNINYPINASFSAPFSILQKSLDPIVLSTTTLSSAIKPNTILPIQSHVKVELHKRENVIQSLKRPKAVLPQISQEKPTLATNFKINGTQKPLSPSKYSKKDTAHLQVQPARSASPLFRKNKTPPTAPRISTPHNTSSEVITFPQSYLDTPIEERDLKKSTQHIDATKAEKRSKSTLPAARKQITTSIATLDFDTAHPQVRDLPFDELQRSISVASSHDSLKFNNEFPKRSIDFHKKSYSVLGFLNKRSKEQPPSPNRRETESRNYTRDEKQQVETNGFTFSYLNGSPKKKSTWAAGFHIPSHMSPQHLVKQSRSELISKLAKGKTNSKTKPSKKDESILEEDPFTMVNISADSYTLPTSPKQTSPPPMQNSYDLDELHQMNTNRDVESQRIEFATLFSQLNNSSKVVKLKLFAKLNILAKKQEIKEFTRQTGLLEEIIFKLQRVKISANLSSVLEEKNVLNLTSKIVDAKHLFKLICYLCYDNRDNSILLRTVGGVAAIVETLDMIVSDEFGELMNLIFRKDFTNQLEFSLHGGITKLIALLESNNTVSKNSLVIALTSVLEANVSNISYAVEHNLVGILLTLIPRYASNNSEKTTENCILLLGELAMQYAEVKNIICSKKAMPMLLQMIEQFTSEPVLHTIALICDNHEAIQNVFRELNGFELMRRIMDESTKAYSILMNTKGEESKALELENIIKKAIVIVSACCRDHLMNQSYIYDSGLMEHILSLFPLPNISTTVAIALGVLSKNHKLNQEMAAKVLAPMAATIFDTQCTNNFQLTCYIRTIYQLVYNSTRNLRELRTLCTNCDLNLLKRIKEESSEQLYLLLSSA